jgi:hypothetical protein
MSVRCAAVLVDGEPKKLALREENLSVRVELSDDDDFEGVPQTAASSSNTAGIKASKASAKAGSSTPAASAGTDSAGAGAKRARSGAASAEQPEAPNGKKAKKVSMSEAQVSRAPLEVAAAAPAAAAPAAGSKAARKRPAGASEPTSGDGGGEDGGGGGGRKGGSSGTGAKGGAGGAGGASGRASGDQTSKWGRKSRQASGAWEAALDAMQPPEGPEDADGGGGGGGGGEATAGAPAAAVAVRDPRMRGFRIGGIGETEQERGEGWCGPWSTATRLIEQREQARSAREEAIAAGTAVEPMVLWKPRRDPATATARRSSFARVPSLQELAVAFLVENIDAVASFGILSPGTQHAIAERLGSVRKFDDHALGLLTAEDAGATELVLPNCSLLTEGAMKQALSRLADHATHPLRLVDLGLCGRPMGPEAVAVLERLSELHTLRLRGCYRLSTPALRSLLGARGAGLTELVLSSNSQFGADSIGLIGAHCGDTLRTLRLEDCDQLPSECLAPLRRLRALTTLSLSGLCLLTDESLLELIDGCAPRLTSLGLRGCSLLSPEAIVSVARLCATLRELDLEGVELVTDTALHAIAESLPALERLSLKGCVQLSDEAVGALAANCRGLSHLSLNKVPGVSDVALLALKTHCADALRVLDLSWCRGVSDHGVGALVDACEGLERLVVWGCSQLTVTFYDGHSNDALQVVGRGVGLA